MTSANISFLNKLKKLFFPSFFISIFFIFLFSSPFFSEIKINNNNEFIAFMNMNNGIDHQNLKVNQYAWKKYAWKTYTLNASEVSIMTDPGTPPVSTQEVKLLSNPFFYPSPFSMSSGTTLGYRINQNAMIELRIFDIRGNEIFRNMHQSFLGYNKISFTQSDFSKHFPSGVYLFLLFYQGKVLGQGKFAVLP